MYYKSVEQGDQPNLKNIYIHTNIPLKTVSKTEVFYFWDYIFNKTQIREKTCMYEGTIVLPTVVKY